MSKQKKIFLPLLIAAHALFSNIITCPTKLSDFDFSSASVLPFYNKRNVKYVILAREAHGTDKGTYDDFGGSRDKQEKHPVITAAREFHEEGILQASIPLSLEKTQDYIDITKENHTKNIIAYTTPAGKGQVTYVTNFNPYKDTFLDRFYTALGQATNWHNLEKDKIAIVEWDVLKKAICDQKDKATVTVSASVLEPNGPSIPKKQNEEITLRPFLVKKLKPFFSDKPYQQGANKKIRFYSDAPIHSAEESLECSAP